MILALLYDFVKRIGGVFETMNWDSFKEYFYHHVQSWQCSGLKKPGAIGETDKLERVKFSPDNIG